MRAWVTATHDHSNLRFSADPGYSVHVGRYTCKHPLWKSISDPTPARCGKSSHKQNSLQSWPKITRRRPKQILVDGMWGISDATGDRFTQCETNTKRSQRSCACHDGMDSTGNTQRTELPRCSQQSLVDCATFHPLRGDGR